VTAGSPFAGIRLEQDNYVIDVFDTRIENPGEAYLTSNRGKGGRMRDEGGQVLHGLRWG
jgi:hypothetical protein